MLILVFSILPSCQSAQEKSVSLVKDRVEKLRPLSKWSPTWCEVETTFTHPAQARYKEMFPKEIDKILESSWRYTWRATESHCELTASEKTSEVVQSHRAFMETAFCLLLQVHWVNSPFDALAVTADQVVDKEGRAHIVTEKDPDLGMYLDPNTTSVETKTKSRGVLSATYSEIDGEWLPSRLEQKTPSANLVVDEIEYSTEHIGRRPVIKSFWISVGSDKPLKHTYVELSRCQRD